MKIKNLILKFIFSSYIVFDDLPSDLKTFSNNLIPFIKKNQLLFIDFEIYVKSP